jgi:hypothetical protein
MMRKQLGKICRHAAVSLLKENVGWSQQEEVYSITSIN